MQSGYFGEDALFPSETLGGWRQLVEVSSAHNRASPSGDTTPNANRRHTLLERSISEKKHKQLRWNILLPTNTGDFQSVLHLHTCAWYFKVIECQPCRMSLFEWPKSFSAMNMSIVSIGTIVL